MTKDNITKQLKEAHNEFITYMNSLTEEEFLYAPKDKWDSSQHADHILKSINMLNKALKVPKWILKQKFGHANRVSKTYDALVAKYLEKLKTAKATPARFQPERIAFSNKNKMLISIEKTIESLIKKMQKISEEKLDYYILPHPLLGKLTLREHFYFSAYHVKHHKSFIKRDLLTNKKNKE